MQILNPFSTKSIRKYRQCLQNYWHSLKKVQERDTFKNQLCEEKGIKLLRIKEEEWDNNRTQVENQIKKFLGIK